MLMGIVYGPRIEGLSSASGAMASSMQYVALGDDNGLMHEINEPSVSKVNAEAVLGWFVSIFGVVVYRWVLSNFIMAILSL